MPLDFVARPPYNVLQPGAYSAVDASQLGQGGGQSGPVPAIIGTTNGGTPLTPLYFTSVGVLRQVLRGGPAYDVARFAFDGGAQRVCVMRVGNSVAQSSLNLVNGSAGTVVTLTSLDYGAWTTGITVAVATGPIITLTYTDPLGNVYTEKWDLTAVGGLTAAQVAQAINGQLYGYTASNFVSAVAGGGALPLSTIAATPLAGGSDGLVPVAGDWTNGLAKLETESVDVVVPATGDATVHAQVLTHCQNLSVPNARKERVGFLGGVLGESVTTVIARMASLRSGRAKLAYPGIKDFNASGQSTLYDPFYLAGKLAGMACALPDPATSLVHARVPIVDVEAALSTIQGGALDQLLAAGITPIAPAIGGGFWVVDDLTGYNGVDGTFRDMPKVRSADYVAQFARRRLETKFVGSKRLASTPGLIQQTATQVLADLLARQIIAAYQAPQVAVGPTPSAWNVGLPVMLVDTNKFIFITVQLQPSATLTQSSVTATDALS